MNRVEELLKIERSIVLRAARSRVWRALTNAREFGRWFGVEVEGEFAPGARLTLEVREPEAYRGMRFPLHVLRVEPEHLFSWRWHPGGEPPDREDAAQMTEVVFTLHDVAEGTRLELVESGFDRVTLLRRAKAYEDNCEGWDYQMKAIERYVVGAS